MEKKELEQKLGQIIYKIGKKQQEATEINKTLQKWQTEANDIATEIEKLDE